MTSGPAHKSGDANEALWQFPCAFPLKIMGVRADDFAQTITAVILRHAPDFDPAGIEFRPSKTGKYIGITATIQAQSKAQLDALYQELSTHPMVKVVL